MRYLDMQQLEPCGLQGFLKCIGVEAPEMPGRVDMMPVGEVQACAQ